MAGKLRKDAGAMGLLFAGVSAMIGSGWLFGPMHAAQSAGALSIWSWVIAAVVVGLIALVYAELAPMFPKSGGLVHMSLVSHGRLVGHIWSWILFLAYVSIAPVEAEAVVTYANSYLPGMIDPHTGLLTSVGFWVAVVVLGVMVAFNFLVLRLVLAINSFATWIKICAPIGTILVLLFASHHPENLAVVKPGSHNFVDMFTAVSTAGVFFSLFGFRQAIDLAGETSNPGRNLPIAVVGTIAIGAAIFIILQWAFVTAIPPELLKDGWGKLTFQGVSGPIAGLAVAIGVSWWAVALYADAIISPAVCGYIWTTATSRVLFATGEEKLAPNWLTRINNGGVPWVALLAAYAVGIIFFFPFPSWQKMVDYASSATVLSYGLGPIVLLQLRRTLPDRERAFRLWVPWVMAPLAFIASNYVMFWAGFAVITFMFVLLLACFIIYVLYFFLIKRPADESFGGEHAWWLVPYFGGMWLLTYFGPTEVGGTGALSMFLDMELIALFSLVAMWLALVAAMPHERVAEHYEIVISEPFEVPSI